MLVVVVEDQKVQREVGKMQWWRRRRPVEGMKQRCPTTPPKNKRPRHPARPRQRQRRPRFWDRGNLPLTWPTRSGNTSTPSN